jgi:transcriptional regulator with XRE-family HTH domain
MARRALPVDPSIGERIRARRELRGWSVRHAASRADVSHTTWSRIERGIQRTDRYTIADLAAALECSVTELTGQPYASADRRLESARIDAERVFRVMMAHPLEDPAVGEAPPADLLSRDADLAADLYGRCDYAGALSRLVSLVPGLHRAPRTRATLTMMVTAYGTAMGSLLNVGMPAHALLAADRCTDAAELLEDPAGIAVAAANRARVSAYTGAYGPARAATARASAELERHLDAPAALDLLGFLHLARAHHSAGLRELGAAQDHLTEAAAIAARTGETDSWHMSWGPRNVGLWQMAMHLDTGQPAKAIETGRSISAADLPAQRQVYYYLDLGRGLADLGRPEDSVRMLLAAERVGPQHARLSTAGRETARSLLRRGAGGSALRGLSERMGVAA